MVLRIDPRIGFRNVDLCKGGLAPLVGYNRAKGCNQIVPAEIGCRSVNRSQNIAFAGRQSLEGLKAGLGKAVTGPMTIRQAQEIANRVEIADAVNHVTVERHRSRDAFAGRRFSIRHEPDRSFGAVLARQIKRMLAPTLANAQARVARGKMDKP